MPTRRDLLLGGAAATLLGCGGRPLPAPRAQQPALGVLRVMTLNLAHGRGLAPLQSRVLPARFFTDNLDVIAALIRRERPDLVALQEAELGSKWAGDFNHVRY